MAKKTAWKQPESVKQFVKWAEKNVEWAKPADISLFERRVNHINFKKNLLIKLDVQVDRDDVGKILDAIIGFAEYKWKPDTVYDIVIKFV